MRCKCVDTPCTGCWNISCFSLAMGVHRNRAGIHCVAGEFKSKPAHSTPPIRMRRLSRSRTHSRLLADRKRGSARQNGCEASSKVYVCARRVQPRAVPNPDPVALTRRLFSEFSRHLALHDPFWSLQAVLEEPEVVLTLASWGFSAHAGFEGHLPPPPPTADVVGSDSAESEISQDTFDGGGDGHGGRRAASNLSGVTTAGVRPKVCIRVFGGTSCVLKEHDLACSWAS